MLFTQFTNTKHEIIAYPDLIGIGLARSGFKARDAWNFVMNFWEIEKVCDDASRVTPSQSTRCPISIEPSLMIAPQVEASSIRILLRLAAYDREGKNKVVDVNHCQNFSHCKDNLGHDPASHTLGGELGNDRGPRPPHR